jgi:hypothetical protein
MKNLETINKKFTVNGQTYKISRFTANTDAEKKFGDNPWIAVHDSYTEADFPLNGLQMLISKDYDELMTRVKIDAAGRTFRAENPNATEMEYLMYIAKLEV